MVAWNSMVDGWHEPVETVAHICKICKEPIMAGEMCYEMDGVFYHEDCFEDNAVKILMDECGAMRCAAEEEREW